MPAVLPTCDGSMPLGLFSGNGVAGASVPTLIYHVPGLGTCIAQAADDALIHWRPLPENPVIPMQTAGPYVVFDPCAWKEGDTYYALIGNKNSTPGYEGDCTSLFRSRDLVRWEYVHPFYASRREWTDEVEDCAVPEFFELDGKHVLVFSTHRPYLCTEYYIGRYADERFTPEHHGRMNWPGVALHGQETLLDGTGRRVFFAKINQQVFPGLRRCGWAHAVTLPRELSLASDGSLRVQPAAQIERLRRNHKRTAAVEVPADGETVIEGIEADVAELHVEMECGGATEYGLKVRCSPGGEEETAIRYDGDTGVLAIDISRSSGGTFRYPAFSKPMKRHGVYVDSQRAPFRIADGERLRLRVFLDKSILEVYANERLCLTQDIYPERNDSLMVRCFSRGGRATVPVVEAWDLQEAGMQPPEGIA
jgi:sucrose-6-phosphate hydrolase SacC (GH32 family)